MKWFRGTQEPERAAIQQAVEELEKARSRRRSALTALCKALDDVQIDDGLVKIGDGLMRTEK